MREDRYKKWRVLVLVNNLLRIKSDVKQMTMLQQHIDKWTDCQECGLCTQRSRIVLGKGSVPCDVLFVGEAPGVSEDTMGLPFVGPAGHLLEDVIEESLADKKLCRICSSLQFVAEEGKYTCNNEHVLGAIGRDIRVAMTNIVSCFPRESKEDGIHAPPEYAIKSCQQRLKEFIGICCPKLIVMVGKLSSKWTPKALPKLIKSCSIDHPAFILRASAAMQGLLIQKAVVTIQNALEDL